VVDVATSVPRARALRTTDARAQECSELEAAWRFTMTHGQVPGMTLRMPGIAHDLAAHKESKSYLKRTRRLKRTISNPNLLVEVERPILPRRHRGTQHN
jgi:hypothetical protein